MEDLIILLLVILLLFVCLKGNKDYSKDIKSIEKSVKNIVVTTLDKINNKEEK